MFGRRRRPSSGGLLLKGTASRSPSGGGGLVEIAGLTAEEIGDIAAAHGIALHELTPQQASLEEAFMALTNDEVEFRAAGHVEPEAEVAA